MRKIQAVTISADATAYRSRYLVHSVLEAMSLDDGNELGDSFKLEYNRTGPTGWVDYEVTGSELITLAALEQLASIPAVRLR